MELVLIGAGGCSAYDVVHILEKGREAVEDCVVETGRRARAETDPKVFTRIHMHFIGQGRRAAPRPRCKRAIDLSIEKYCSATAMLAKTAAVTHDFEVVDTAASMEVRPVDRALPRHQRLDAVGDELHGERGEQHAEQSGQDRAAGFAENAVDALGQQEDQIGKHKADRDDADQRSLGRRPAGTSRTAAQSPRWHQGRRSAESPAGKPQRCGSDPW